MKAKPRIVVIGGGTGTYTVLTGLKKYPLHLSAIISMMDSGGSNRVIRDEFGLLPTSDIRQCIVGLASAESNEVLRKLFTYRYNQGTGIAGMTFGNLFMAALTDIYGSQKKAIEQTCKLLNVKGKIIPVTYDNVQLAAKYENGKMVLGEHFIDEPDEQIGKYRISELSVIPDAKANFEAIKAIEKADLIVMGPGDLYTSILCNLVVDGMREALQKSPAKIIYVMNLMTKFGQTNNLTAREILKEVEKYISRKVDIVLLNSRHSYPKNVLRRYKLEQSEPTMDDLGNLKNIIREDFVSDEVYESQNSDRLKRSFIRHDPEKLARKIVLYSR